ncbi:MAG TPA: hypothetical protein VHJ54_03065 [Solirubrobacterales bacterium]|jgi:hypothetical protein|nr:hypothetical protein [Solirubrobacterales bacterium]
MRLYGRRRARADRLTLGLAGVALATAGTVVGGELIRLARRRRRVAEMPETALDTAERAIIVTGAAAQDTVAVAVSGYEAAPRHETILFNVLGGFLAGFALIRSSTYSIRRGWNPFGSVHVGGRHVHHFVPGIVLAFAAGGAGLVTQSDRLEELLAFPFGAGIGLTFDEAALLLELEDVYWTREGVLSVQLSLGLAALLGATILALRMLRRGERQTEELGLIPSPDVQPLWRSA